MGFVGDGGMVSYGLHVRKCISENIISPPQAEIFRISKGITILECIFSEGIRDFQRSKSSKFPACGGLRLSFSELRGMPSRLRTSIGLHKFSALRAECLPA